MPSVTIFQATPGKLNRRKAEVGSVPELRKEASQLSNLPENRFRLLWQGHVVVDEFDIKKISNGLVMLVPMAEPNPAPAPKPEPVSVSDDEIQRFRVAFGSAIQNPAFSKVVKRLLVRENMDSLAAACPGLGDDCVAQAFLTRPELLTQLLDPESLKKIGEKHPSLLEAAHNLAAAVHEEQAAAGRSTAAEQPGAAAEPEPGSYYLDEMSDEEMEEDEAATAGRGARGTQITTEQLAAALAAAAGGSNPFMGVTGLAAHPHQEQQRLSRGSSGTSAAQSTATTPGALRITADMFQAAMQQAMLGMGGGSGPVTPAPAVQAPAPLPDWSSQLSTMRDMGIVDEGLATRALQVMGGDLQAAVDLIFSGWIGDDEAMQ